MGGSASAGSRLSVLLLPPLLLVLPLSVRRSGCCSATAPGLGSRPQSRTTGMLQKPQGGMVPGA